MARKTGKVGIDYCYGGKRPLGQAIAATGIEWQAFVATLNDHPVPEERNVSRTLRQLDARV